MDWKLTQPHLKLSPVNGNARMRLHQITFAWSEDDLFDIELGFDGLMGMLQTSNALTQSTVKVFLYQGTPHMGASEALLNHLDSVHKMLWLGEVDSPLL